MTSILFLCLGNICRSPMAEFIMKDMIARKARETGNPGLEKEFLVESAAVSYEQEGDDMYPPAKRTLDSHGIRYSSRRAHRVSEDEASDADIIIIMDESNRRMLSRIVSDGNMVKVHKMMEYAPGASYGRVPDVADPWYTGEFETTYRDLVAGCSGLLDKLMKERG